MAGELRDAVKAAGDLLGAFAGKPWHVEASKVQSEALVQAIGAKSLDVSVKASLAATVSGMAWAAPADRDAVLTVLFGGGAAAPTSRPRRRTTQTWTNCSNYFPQSVWNVLFDQDMVSNVKTDAIKSFLLRLGLRSPCEYTSKTIAMISLCAVEGVRPATQTDPVMRHAYVTQWKKCFKRKASNAPAPPVYLEELPSDPKALRTAYPDIWQSAYGDNDPPVKCKWDTMDMLTLESGFGCRSTHMSLNSTRTAGAAMSSGGQMEVVTLLRALGNAFQQQQQPLPTGLQIFDRRQQPSAPNMKMLESLPPAPRAIAWEARPP